MAVIRCCMVVVCAQLRPTLFKPMDCSLPGSSVHEIFQERILEISGSYQVVQSVRNELACIVVTTRPLSE